MATVQTTPEEIAALSPTPLDDEPAFDEPGSAAASVQGPDRETQVALVPAPAPPKPVQVAPREPQPAADLETFEAAAERERADREIFGIEDPKPRRRWRRRRRAARLRSRRDKTPVARAKLWPASRPANNSNDGGVAPRGR